MKTQTIIILVLCILLIAVIALNVTGVIPPQGSFAGSSGTWVAPTSSPPNTVPSLGSDWDHSEPTDV